MPVAADDAARFSRDVEAFWLGWFMGGCRLGHSAAAFHAVKHTLSSSPPLTPAVTSKLPPSMTDTSPDPDNDPDAEHESDAATKCGVDTTDGGVCQNPAGDNGRCWIPSHNNPDAENPHGRPSKLDEYEADIMAAARKGLTYEGIARVAGIGVSTLNDWRDEYDDFSASLERARSHAEQKLIEDVDAEFVLERSYDYTKTETRELEHSGGTDGPLMVIDNSDSQEADDVDD